MPIYLGEKVELFYCFPGSSDFVGINHYFTETVKHGLVDTDPSFERDVEAVSIQENVSMNTEV